MSDKTNGKLYKINTTQKDIKRLSIARKIEAIIHNYNSKKSVKEIEEGLKFSKIDLKSSHSSYKEYNISLYTLVSPLKAPVWKSFLDTITEDNNDYLKSMNSSFLLFIYNKTEIYTLSRGYHGNAVIKDYVINNFGIDVISCLLEISKTEIKSLNERKFFGDEIYSQRIFRENFVLSYDDNFGKIYNQVIADINKKNFKDLGIENKRKIDKVSVDVSDYIEISSVFDFNELINRISCFSHLLNTTSNKDKAIINHFKILNGSNNKIIQKLNSDLYSLCYLNSFERKGDIDFFYKDILLMLNSKKLEVIDKGTNQVYYETDDLKSLNLNSILEKINEEIDYEEDDFIDVMNLINFNLLVTINGVEESYPTNFFDWINAEINYENKDYFRMDGLWYEIQNDLKKYISNELDLLFDKANVYKNLLKWEKTLNSQTGKLSYLEGDFNDLHKSKDCFIVADKCTYNGVELADLIFIEKDKIILFHVKKGIAGELRVLASQIINSARTFRHESRKVLLKNFYKTVKKIQYDNDNIFYLKDGVKIIVNEKDFIGLFMNRKIEFVFAVSSKSDITKDFKRVIKSGKSRIAKLSMINVHKEIRKFDFELNFELIEEA